jgi:molybdopterin molybdotransferase
MTRSDVPWHEARLVAHDVAPRKKVARIGLDESLGRVIASDIRATVDLPPFAASRIDGWAVNGPGPWQIVGGSLAGEISELTLEPGECIHIATGAALPTGTNACLKDEESRLEGAVVHTTGNAPVQPDGSLPEGHDMRPQGYEARRDEVVVPAGLRVTPAVLGMMAGAGHDEVDVFERVTVHVLIFGDELLSQGASGRGRVRDSLGPQLPAWIDYLGAECVGVAHVADTLEDHTRAIADSTADLIVTTGGTAAGPVDHLHSAIEACGGQLDIDAVLVRPGYHQLLASLPQRHLIGLPGNPQSALVGLMTLVDAFIRGSYNQDVRTLGMRTLAESVPGPAREHRFALCQYNGETVQPVEHVDSSMLRGFVLADGYAVVRPGGQDAGSLVEWLDLPRAVG